MEAKSVIEETEGQPYEVEGGSMSETGKWGRWNSAFLKVDRIYIMPAEDIGDGKTKQVSYYLSRSGRKASDPFYGVEMNTSVLKGEEILENECSHEPVGKAEVKGVNYIPGNDSQEGRYESYKLIITPISESTSDN
jgi:hypothetical protein